MSSHTGTGTPADPYESLCAALSDATAQRDLLVTTLAEVLGNFHEKGHPGRPGIRTGWVREETYAKWHGVLAGIVAAQP